VTLDPPHLHVTCHPDKTPEVALSALDDEIRRVQDSPVSGDEIARAVKQAHAIFAYGSENITNQAFWLGFAEMFDSYDWFLHYLERLAEVTAADVQRVAQEYLRPQNRVVGTYRPSDGER
jgi:zinc protease